MRPADAIPLGAIGHPAVKPGILEIKDWFWELRCRLYQCINRRPGGRPHRRRLIRRPEFRRAKTRNGVRGATTAGNAAPA
jgi:hypothetical protein